MPINIFTFLRCKKKSNKIAQVICNLDYVLRWEGEESILELIDAIQNNRQIESVKGVAFIKDNEIVVREKRCPPKNISGIRAYVRI